MVVERALGPVWRSHTRDVAVAVVVVGSTPQGLKMGGWVQVCVVCTYFFANQQQKYRIYPPLLSHTDTTGPRHCNEASSHPTSSHPPVLPGERKRRWARLGGWVAMRSHDVSWPWNGGHTLISQSVCGVQAGNAVCGQVCDVAVYDCGIKFSPACLVKQTNWTLVVHPARTTRTQQTQPAQASTTARHQLLLRSNRSSHHPLEFP
jgi:hypothetical protein